MSDENLQNWQSNKKLKRFLMHELLGGGQLWPAGLRSDLNGQLAGQYKRSILAVNLTAAFLTVRELVSRLWTVFIKADLSRAGHKTDRP
ncbi:hypothetical protein BpHYR1_009671 [Brachionus plicatilis]|uniref:Uncharacterized protein n=1 Tax=Brachionus plicatilis TaxID=10195 RepID=A0A3M7SKK0_BRAPC|nr:hypothetical protein BpHYR1_009671 [Brachionus plicatilis]